MHRVFERFALSVQDHATGNGPHEYVRTLPVWRWSRMHSVFVRLALGGEDHATGNLVE